MSRNTSRNTREDKRAKFSKATERPKMPTLVVAAVVILIAGAILLWSRGRFQAAPTTASPAESLENTTQDDSIRLPLFTFDDGQAHFYTYEAESTTIEFFVLKSNDGVIRAAFNACDVCYPAHRGYRQEGDEMVCNNCGQRFPSALINEVRGGCNPAPLDRAVEDNELVIRTADILTGISYFQ